MRILEEVWYSNIEPTAYNISSCKGYKKLLASICWNEEKPKVTTMEEQKDIGGIKVLHITRGRNLREGVVFDDKIPILANGDSLH